MNILITGGAGFIGSHLAAYHITKNDTVFVLDNLITGNKRNIQSLQKNPKFTFTKTDITTVNIKTLPKVDVIYNLASPASPIQYKKYPIKTLLTNSVGTKNMLDYANMHKAVFLLASTSEVYGDPLEHPQKETYYGNVNPIGPRACYDEAKRFAETLAVSYIKQYDTDVRIARIFNTYGPHMEKNDGRAVSNFVTQALTKKPITIYGSGKQTRSFCYVSDLVEGLARLAEKKGLQGTVINLGNPYELSIIELATRIVKQTDTKSKIVFGPESDENDPKKRKPDIGRAKSILNWDPKIPLEKGLQKTIDYFKSIL